MKKIFWALIIVVVAAVLGLGTYWFFDRQENGGPSVGNISVGDLFPFGAGNNTPNDGEAPTNNELAPTDTAPPARLWKISASPQAGAGIFVKGTETFVRFVDRAMGNVYEAQISERQTPVRISNTTIPKIREALWSADGESALLRYTNDAGIIQTMHAELVPMQAGGTATSSNSQSAESAGQIAGVQELQGTFLPSNISDLAVFTPKNKVFYMTKSGTGSGMGYTSLINGASPAKVFESPINEWTIAWPREATVVLTTKPSAFAAGYSYAVNPNTGAMSKLIGGINGLAVAPAPNLTKIAFSESANNSADLKIFDTKTGATNLAAKTFAEKCVWRKDSVRLLCAVPKSFPNAIYPDSWYDGQVSFSDSIVSIDSLGGEPQIVAELDSLAGESIDAINLNLDANEQFLIFTNKKDSALWVFNLAGE